MSNRWKAILDRVAVATFVVAWTILFFRLGPSIASQGSWLVVVLGVFAGYLLADLLAGVVHWIADRFFDPNTPVLGALLIEPFRDHHEDALGITRHDLFEVSGNNALVTIPVVAWLAYRPPPVDALSSLLAVTGASVTLALFATNFFHRWAHAPSPPRVARHLQRWGLILSPKRHAVHHRGGHDRAYCVTSGWLNPLLDRIRLFDRLEHAVDAMRGHRRRAI